MKKFGNYSKLVEEVISFVENGNLLRQAYRQIDDEIDMTTRTIFSLEDVDRFRDPDWPNSEIKGDMAWLDVQRVDENLFSSDWSEEFTEVTQPAIESIQVKMWKRVERQLRGVLPHVEIQQVDGFFFHLMYLRGASGRTKSFDERLYKVYQADGYPCGWAGTYPEGELIVFSREYSG